MPLIFLLLFLSFSLSAKAYSECECQLGVGYRQDSLNWNIADPTGSPNILSELTWSDLKSVQLMGNARMTAACGWYFRLSGDYGWICSGRNRDSDFDGDDMTLEFSRALSKSDQGTVYDASVGFGSRCFSLGFIKIVPLIGFGAHGQNLHFTNGVQVVSDNPDLLGPIKGLHSTYRTIWFGPWTGVDVFLVLGSLSLWGSVEYHRVWYHARGHWNLRTDWVDDFRHNTCANGFVTSGGLDWNVGWDWLLGVAYNLQEWRSESGEHRVFAGTVLDGIEGVSEGGTRLNQVNWHSWSVSLTLTKLF